MDTDPNLLSGLALQGSDVSPSMAVSTRTDSTICARRWCVPTSSRRTSSAPATPTSQQRRIDTLHEHIFRPPKRCPAGRPGQPMLAEWMVTWWRASSNRSGREPGCPAAGAAEREAKDARGASGRASSLPWLDVLDGGARAAQGGGGRGRGLLGDVRSRSRGLSTSCGCRRSLRWRPRRLCRWSRRPMRSSRAAPAGGGDRRSRSRGHREPELSRCRGAGRSSRRGDLPARLRLSGAAARPRADDARHGVRPCVADEARRDGDEHHGARQRGVIGLDDPLAKYVPECD